MPPSFILASRSPRRQELLRLIVPGDRIEVLPPRDASEAGFEGLHDLPAIQKRLAEIARVKAADVAEQVSSKGPMDGGGPVIIAADTTVIVSSDKGTYEVLGQPPADDTWNNVVRSWFRKYYAGRSHLVLTALCVRGRAGQTVERTVSTEVTFIRDVDQHLEWYIETQEPLGKAGGYGVQGAGSIFISGVNGSLSNVIGLPLEALLEVFQELQIDVGADSFREPGTN